MSEQITNIQIRIPVDIKDRLIARAKVLGFSSFNGFGSVVLHWAALKPNMSLMDLAITGLTDEKLEVIGRPKQKAKKTEKSKQKKVAVKAS